MKTVRIAAVALLALSALAAVRSSQSHTPIVISAAEPTPICPAKNCPTQPGPSLK